MVDLTVPIEVLGSEHRGHSPQKRETGDFRLQNCDIQIPLVYKAPSLWYFVIAGQTDSDTNTPRTSVAWDVCGLASLRVC